MGDTGTKDKLQGLESNAAEMMKELGDLSARLKEIGKGKAGELSQEAMEQLNSQLSNLQGRIKELGEGSSKLLEQVDKSVRANPYLYIAGALGLGVILGKALRS